MAPTLADLSPHTPAPHHHISPLLVAMAVLLAASFLLAVSYFIYSALPPRHHHHHHPDVLSRHHPSLHIATEGLHPSAIKSIATCEYKDTKSLAHGTDCAVCLAEFEAGESLRLLPTCSHAFHVLCIDTWLASHTTCPICRAPVLPPAMGLPSKGAHIVEIIPGLGSS